MASYVNTASTVKLQKIVNIAKAHGDIFPILNVAGTSVELPLAIANDVMDAICRFRFRGNGMIFLCRSSWPIRINKTTQAFIQTELLL